METSPILTSTETAKFSPIPISSESTKSPQDVPLSPLAATLPTSNPTNADLPPPSAPDPSPSTTQFCGHNIKPLRPKPRSSILMML